MTTEWTRPSWLGNSNYEEHEVNGETLRFYPVSVELLFRLRTWGKPLAQGLALLVNGTGQDQTVTYRSVDGAQEDVVQAIQPELLREKFSLKSEVFSDLVETFTDRKNARLVAEIIMDSLRDDIPSGKERPSPDAFMQDLDITTLMALIEGVFKANGNALAPVTEGNLQTPLATVVGAGTSGETSKTSLSS